MFKDDSGVAGAHELCRQHKILVAQGEHLTTQLAGQPGPADERENQRHRKVNPHRGPRRRDRRRERHPQRNRREGAHQLDHPLNQLIDPTAKEAGDHAQYRAQRQT